MEEEVEERPKRRRTLRIKDLSTLSDEDRAQLVEMVMEDGETLGAIGEAVDAAEGGESAGPLPPGTITPEHINGQLDIISITEQVAVQNVMRRKFNLACPPEALQCFLFPSAFREQHAQGLADLENEFIPETWRIYMTGGEKYRSLIALGMVMYGQWRGFKEVMIEFAKTHAAVGPNGSVAETEAPTPVQ